MVDYPKTPVIDSAAILDAMIPSVKMIVAPHIIIVPPTNYFPVNYPRPVVIEPLDPATAGIIYSNPNSNPANDAMARQSQGGAFLYAKGQWYIKHSAATNQSFRVEDSGGSGATTQAAPASVPAPLAPPTPVTWGTHVSVPIDASSATALAANAARRAMLFTNKSTGGQAITLNLAGGTAVAGQGLVLVPNQTVIWNPIDSPAVSLITAIASAAGGLLGVAEGT